jgi:iron complex outermembrane receptor protein
MSPLLALLAVLLAQAPEPQPVPEPAQPADDLDLVALIRAGTTATSATGQSQRVELAPAVLSVLGREWLRATGARTVAEALQSVPGLFVNHDQALYDVGVRGLSGGMRGGSRSLLVLIDGQPIALRDSGITLLGPEAVPLSAVERIEVIRGPASALYGADAFLGVVNVVTRSGGALEESGVQVSATGFGAGLQPGASFELHLGRRAGPFDLFVADSRTVQDRDGLRLPCGTVYPDAADPCAAQTAAAQDPTIFGRASFDDRQRTASTLVKIGADLGLLFGKGEGTWGRVELEGGRQELITSANFSDWAVLQEERVVLPDGSVLRVPGTGNQLAQDNLWTRLRVQVPLLDGRVELGGRLSWAAGGPDDEQHLRGQESLSGAARAALASEGFRSLSGDLSARALLLESSGQVAGQAAPWVDELSLLVSADWTRDWITFVANALPTPPEVREAPLTQVGALGQLTGSFFGRRVGLVLGLRFDSHRGAVLTPYELSLMRIGRSGSAATLCGSRVCYDQPSLRAGLTGVLARNLGVVAGRRLFDELWAKALFGTAFRAPPASFLYEDGLYGVKPLRPNPGLQPETLATGELALGASMLSGALDWNLAAYQSRVSGLAEVSAVVGGVMASNLDDVHTTGVELQAALRLRPVELRLSFARQWSERIFSDPTALAILQPSGFPDWTLSGAALVRLPWLRSKLALGLRALGPQTGSPLNGRGDREQFKYRLPAYALADLHLSTEPLPLLDPAWPTRFHLGVRNLLGAQTALPGFQPFYGTDLPGEPRTFTAGVEQGW